METLDEILRQQQHRGGQAEARAGVAPRQTAPEPQEKPQQAPPAEIKGRSRLNPGGDANAPANGGEKSLSAATEAPTVQAASDTPGTPPATGQHSAEADAMQKWRDWVSQQAPPTPEELEKEKKRQKREQIFAAIGDGVAALSNLYFASQYAPNMYDGNNSMSKSVQVNYDKLRTERDKKNAEHFNNMLKMRQLDEAAADKERSWQRQLGLDEDARQRYKDEKEYRNERERISDERYTQEQATRKAREEEDARRWQATFDENKRRADRSHNFQVTQHNDNVAVYREQAAATRAKGVRGKQLGFSDGKGNKVAIYENVWKGSMQSVFDAMVAEGVGRDDKIADSTWQRRTAKMTPSQKEDYVKQHWHKSPKASQIMLTLSGIDPATMTSEVSDEDGGLGWGNSNSNNSNKTDW